MTATHRLTPRTALTVQPEHGVDVVYLSHLPTAQIVVAPDPGAQIILGALGRAPSSDHPDAPDYLDQLTERGLLVSVDDEAAGEVATDQLRVLISAQPTSPWFAAALPPHWRVLPRPIEAGSAVAVAGRRLRTGWQLVRRSPTVDVLVLSSAGYEMVLLGLLRPLVRCPLVIHDPILPSARVAQILLGFLAAGFDAVWCIRTSDLPQWRRAARTIFIPFFGPAVAPDQPVAAATEPPSIYSGGTAHRDFAVVIDAAAAVGLPTIIGTIQSLPPLPANVAQQTPRTAAEGRAMQDRAGISVFILQPTVLAAGPTVLLDAMAAGAAIVCNDATGHRDYVTHGVDALVVSTIPRADEVARAIETLSADRDLRVRLGSAARERVTQLGAPHLVQSCVAEIERVVAASRAAGRGTALRSRVRRLWPGASP